MKKQVPYRFQRLYCGCHEKAAVKAWVNLYLLQKKANEYVATLFQDRYRHELGNPEVSRIKPMTLKYCSICVSGISYREKQRRKNRRISPRFEYPRFLPSFYARTFSVSLTIKALGSKTRYAFWSIQSQSFGSINSRSKFQTTLERMSRASARKSLSCISSIEFNNKWRCSLRQRDFL